MSRIIDISEAYPTPVSLSPAVARSAPSRPAVTTFDGDTFTFSREALARAVAYSSLRIATTAAIRAEIEGGTYETPERIDAAVTRLLDVIG